MSGAKKGQHKVLTWIAVIGMALWPVISNAYFQDLGVGVRPIGMGESFVAVADDSNALLWNAAGLADLEKRELNLMYASLYTGLEARLFTGENDYLGYNNIAFTMPVGPEYGTFGLGWTLFNSAFYRENTVIIGYGREVGTELFEWLKAGERVKKIRLNSGINLKVLNWIADENEFTQSNSSLAISSLSRTNVTADISFLVHWIEDVKFGLSLENIIPAEVGILTSEVVPFNLRLGASYLHHWDKRIMPYMDSLLGTMEFTYRNEIYDIRVGTEGWFLNNRIAVRMGTTVDNFSTGLSVKIFLPKLRRELPHRKTYPVDLRIDYAFTYPYALQETFGSHRISIVVNWGPQIAGRRDPISNNRKSVVEADKELMPVQEVEALNKQKENK